MGRTTSHTQDSTTASTSPASTWWPLPAVQPPAINALTVLDVPLGSKYTGDAGGTFLGYGLKCGRSFAGITTCAAGTCCLSSVIWHPLREFEVDSCARRGKRPAGVPRLRLDAVDPNQPQWSKEFQEEYKLQLKLEELRMEADAIAAVDLEHASLEVSIAPGSHRHCDQGDQAKGTPHNEATLAAELSQKNIVSPCEAVVGHLWKL